MLCTISTLTELFQKKLPCAQHAVSRCSSLSVPTSERSSPETAATPGMAAMRGAMSPGMVPRNSSAMILSHAAKIGCDNFILERSQEGIAIGLCHAVPRLAQCVLGHRGSVECPTSTKRRLSGPCAGTLSLSSALCCSDVSSLFDFLTYLRCCIDRIECRHDAFGACPAPHNITQQDRKHQFASCNLLDNDH